MTHSVRVADFLPSVNGFPFPNCYDKGRRFHLFETPFGAVGVADATRGLCGGMIFTAMDLYYAGVRPVPQSPTDPVFRYFCRRLFTSWGLPFAWVKYWDWQMRPMTSTSIAGVTVRDGVSRLTREGEWPRVRAALDRGELTALGLVKETGLSPAKLGLNHQVLAYGYDLNDETGDVTILVYDPNHPCDDTVALTFNLTDPDSGTPVTHSIGGPTVRGVFATEYYPPRRPPLFEEPPGGPM